jgi:gliding motility-associated-like protein
MVKLVGFLTILIFSYLVVNGQNNICIGDGINICAGEQVNIELCTGTGTPDTNVVFLNNSSTVNLGDDQYSGIVPIGFNFTFYGANYNNCVISSNGYITFNTGVANGFSPWAINNAVPNPALPVNTVMAPWQDYNPGAAASGPVAYATIGTAPNRRFVVLWKDMIMFGTQQLGCSAVVLHETSNKIEVFLDEKPVVAWNGGAAIEATHNLNGTLADVVSGRNWPTQWTANLDGQEWIPDGPNNYIQNAIPYKAYVIGNVANVWGDTQGNVYNPTGAVLNVTPTPPAGVDSIGYFVNYSSCATNQLLTSDTSWVKIYTAVGDYTEVNCPGGSDGTATVTVDPTPPPGTTITYDWVGLGETNQTVTDLPAGSYTVNVDIDGGCQTSVVINVTEAPGIQLNLVSSTDVSCNSGNDGQAIIEVNQGAQPYQYSWSNSNSNGPIANDLPAGITTVSVTDDNDCTVELDIPINEPDPLELTFITQDLEICDGDTALVSAQGAGGSSDYIYNWTLNGNSIGSGDSILVVPDVSNSLVCVTLAEACGSPTTDTCMNIFFPTPVDPIIQTDIIGDCYPVFIQFENNSPSPDVAYTVWDYGNGQIDTVNGLNPTSQWYNNPGVYTVNVELVTNQGCSFYGTFPNIVYAYDYPDASFSLNPNPASLYEPYVDAYNQSSSDAIIFDWTAPGANPSSGTDYDMNFTYPFEEGEYEVTLYVENQFGCPDTLTQILEVIDEVTIFAPNAFTPDGNKHNETWRVHIRGIDIFNYHLMIFNRWGEVVFESYNPNSEWDGTYNGKAVPDGVYVWRIQALDERTDKQYEFNGHITIIR